MKVCRICLSTDGRLYPINSNGLYSLYHQLTGVPKPKVAFEKKLPQWLCAECGLRLMSYEKLRDKSLRSYKILCELLEKASDITEKDISEIDREKNDLQSNLSYKILDNGIIEEYATELQEINETDWKKEIKVEEFVLNLQLDDSLIVSEAENSDCPLKSVSNSSSSSDLDSDSPLKSISNSAPCSDLEDLGASSDSSISVNTYMKTRNEKECLEIQKRVDKYMNSLQKKLSKRVKKVAVKKEIRRNKDPFVFEDYFIVQVFSLDEQVAVVERRKYSTNYTNAPFKCDDCFKGFGSKVTFARHRLYHSDKRGKFECALCHFKYPTKKYYLRHMEAHKYRYSCKLCNFSSNRRCVSIKHGWKHNGKVFECPHCPMQFANQSSYLSHLRIKHVSAFVCEFCGFSFLSAKGVNFHKALKHRFEKDNVSVSTDGPSCATCDIRFVSDEALNTHLRVSHPQRPGAKMRNDETRLQYRSRPIQCEICGQDIQDGRAYRSHFRRVHPEEQPKRTFTKYKPKANVPSMCDQCGRVFKCKANLQMHEVVHSGQKPFACPECDAKYSFKTNLTQHILRAHRTDRLNEPKVPHPCSICGKKFANSSNRIRHMVVHNDQRPFPCEVCGKTFKSRAEVHSHTAHVHLKKPWPKSSRGSQQNR